MTSPIVVAALAAASILMMLAERLGAPVVLALAFKGDVKRETRWFAQYGQGACTLTVAALLICFDNHPLRYGFRPAGLLLVTVFGTSLLCMGIKRLLGRVRPGRENAGRFLGPTLKHANYRESFPSSHSAAAVAMTVVLAFFYPAGAIVFWVLAIMCALLRYVMDAHWPSDVLGGIAIGYAIARLMCAWTAGG